MSLFFNINFTRLTVAAGVIIAGILIPAVRFGYFYRPNAGETTCIDIPAGSVVLVPGFDYGVNPDGMILPGDGNRYLAKKPAACAGRLSAVITQEAVIEGLGEIGALSGGQLNGEVPIYRMHRHRPGVTVRTLQSLACAIGRLSPAPDTLVMLVHDKHQERAEQDLRAVFDGEIIRWRVGEVPFFDNDPLNPLRWALRELYLARPAEAFLRRAGKKPNLSLPERMAANALGGSDCPAAVEIREPINLNDSSAAGDLPVR